VPFDDPGLLELALTHRSYAFETGGIPTNERLEFLGDAVLGLVVTDLAYNLFPDLSEGELAKLRAATVNMTTLAEVARELGLGAHIRLGKGEELSGGRDKASILADGLEALLGAVYLDRGLEVAGDLVRRLIRPRIDMYASGEGERDFKTTLQELAAQGVGDIPRYEITERGPDHAKEFTAVVFLGDKPYGRGEGRSKKEAEQRAAHQAFDALTGTDRASLAKEG
jgi:ribonuclease-3